MLNLPVFLGKHARHISLLSVETVQRCSEEMYQSHESEIFRDRRRKQRIFVEKLSGTFCRRSGTFLPFFARPRAIALGSKPPLVTRIARTGLGTRLYNTINWRDTTYLDSEDDRTGCRNIRMSMSTTTVLFRTTVTRTMKLNLLLKWLLDLNLSHDN